MARRIKMSAEERKRRARERYRRENWIEKDFPITAERLFMPDGSPR